MSLRAVTARQTDSTILTSESTVTRRSQTDAEMGDHRSTRSGKLIQPGARESPGRSSLSNLESKN